MTVADLIEKLKTFKQDAPVYVEPHYVYANAERRRFARANDARAEEAEYVIGFLWRIPPVTWEPEEKTNGSSKLRRTDV